MLVSLLIFVILAIGVMMIWQNKQYQDSLTDQELRGLELRKKALHERDQLLDALNDALLLVNETSHIVFANASARNLVLSLIHI